MKLNYNNGVKWNLDKSRIYFQHFRSYWCQSQLVPNWSARLWQLRSKCPLSVLTFDAGVAGLQVRRQVLGARLVDLTQVRDLKAAVPCPWTAPVHLPHHISCAADEAIVTVDTPPHTHPTVTSQFHKNDFIRSTLGVKWLELTIIPHTWKGKRHIVSDWDSWVQRLQYTS